MMKYIAKTIVLFIVLLTSGCSSNNWFYPYAESNSPAEAAIYLGIGLSMAPAPDKSCAGKSGEKKTACEQQVNDIKEHIARSQKN